MNCDLPVHGQSTPTMYLQVTRSTARYLIVSRRRLATDPQLIHRLHSRPPSGWPRTERSATAEHFQIETPLRPPLLADVSFIPRRRAWLLLPSFVLHHRQSEAGRPAERHHRFQLLLRRCGAGRRFASKSTRAIIEFLRSLKFQINLFCDL